MANQTQDVELRIRATNYSRKTTREIVDDLKDLRKAQDAQIESAKEGSATAADLEKSYGGMESAIKALLSQNALTKLFEQQTKTLADLQTKLDAARKAQDDYAKTLTAGAKGTSAQQAKMKQLAKAVSDVEKSINGAEGRISSTTGRLAQFGITSTNLAEKQRDIVSAVTAANAALERQERAIESVDSDAKGRREQQAAIAMREKQNQVDTIFAQAQQKLAADLAASTRAQQAANAATREAAQAQAMLNAINDAELEALFTREANKYTEAMNRQAAAIRAAADAAERNMRASAANARRTPAVQGSNVGGAIRDIQDPAAAALRSVSGLEASLSSLQQRVTAIRGPIQDYRGILRDATAAQQALNAMAGQVDGYNRQIAAVRAARAEYAEARTQVIALTAQLRAGGDVAAPLRQAQATLDRAASSLSNLTSAARASQQALRQAGVDTRNMSAAEQQLIQQAQRATQTMNQLTDAHRRNGAAADNAGSRIFNWFGGANGRTTLSYTQRLRGEVLSLASAFVGIYGAINGVQKILEAYRNKQAITSQLTIANGQDSRKAAEDFKYLEAAADRIGFVLKDVAPAYAKFSIAMKAAGFDTQSTRFAFENIAGAAVKARLSTEELTGILKAFEQIASKGKVQAEELRGQLGDRLPGAFQIAARAAGKTVEEYTKMMELGEVGSDQVINIARELGKTYGAAEAGATTLLQAEARFQNATQRFLTATAEGGFVEAYQAFLTRLTTLLNDGTADKFAKQLSTALVLVVDVLQKVVDNADLVKYAFIAMIGVNIIRWLVSLPVLFRAVATEAGLLSGVLLTVNTRLGAMAAASAISGAAATGLSGVLLRSLVPALTGVATALTLVTKALPLLAAAFVAYEAGSAIVDRLKSGTLKEVQAAVDASTKATKDAEEARAALTRAAGTKEEAEAKARYGRLRDIAVQALKDEQKAIEKGRASFYGLDEEKVRRRKDELPAVGTVDPGDVGGDAQKLKLIQTKLAKDQKQIDKELQTARLNGAKQNLSERLRLVDAEYDEQRKNANEQIKDEKIRAQALAEINKTSLNAQAVERARYANEQGKRDASEGNKRVRIAEDIKAKLEAIEDDVAKRAAELDVTEPYETRRIARVNAITHAYDDLEKKIREQYKLDPKAAAASAAQLEIYKKQRVEIENTNSARDEANRLAGEFTKSQQIQDINLKSINEQVESGQLSVAEGLKRTNDEVARTAPEIQAAGERAEAFARSVQKLLDPVKFAEIMATVGSGLAKADVTARQAANNVVASQRMLNTLLEAEQRERDQIQLERSLGVITAEQEVAKLNEVQQRYGAAILAQAQNLQTFLGIARTANAMSAEDLDALDAKTKQIVTNVTYARKNFSELDKTIVDSIASNGATAFNAIAESMANVITGQQTIAQGFRGMLQAAGQFFASLLRDLAMAILRTQILKAIQNSSFFGGGVQAAAGQALGAGGMHTGGTVGKDRTFTRRVDPAVFRNAVRYHDGGLPGLRSDEVPTILQKGEEVLAKDNPRNVLNGGGAGGAAADPTGFRFVLVDDRASVPEAMQSSDGDRVIMQSLKRNVATLKTLLK